jgi:Methylamine utilisation protein MauE
MVKTARFVEILLGIFFIFSAATKAGSLDGFGVVISAYGVLKDPEAVRLAAYFSLCMESLLGAAFLAGWRFGGIAYFGAILLTVVFSGLIVYGWQVNGLEDCGCFGTAIKMGPQASLLKNGILIIVLIGAWLGLREADHLHTRTVLPKHWTRVMAGVGLTVVAVLYLMGNQTHDDSDKIAPAANASDKDFPYVFSTEGQDFDLGDGNHLVVLLNTECEHCKASVPGLNALYESDALPDMVALMMGNDTTLDDFLLETEPTFPMQLMDDLQFMAHIKSAPPILYYLQDGFIQHFWEWEDDPPTAAEISESISVP